MNVDQLAPPTESEPRTRWVPGTRHFCVTSIDDISARGLRVSAEASERLILPAHPSDGRGCFGEGEQRLSMLMLLNEVVSARQPCFSDVQQGSMEF